MGSGRVTQRVYRDLRGFRNSARRVGGIADRELSPIADGCLTLRSCRPLGGSADCLLDSVGY